MAIVKAKSVKKAHKYGPENRVLYALSHDSKSFRFIRKDKGHNDFDFFEYIEKQGYNANSPYELSLDIKGRDGILVIPEPYLAIHRDNTRYIVNVEGMDIKDLLNASTKRAKVYKKFVEAIEKINPFLYQPIISISNGEIYVHGSYLSPINNAPSMFNTTELIGTLEDKARILHKVICGSHKVMKGKLKNNTVSLVLDLDGKSDELFEALVNTHGHQISRNSIEIEKE